MKYFGTAEATAGKILDAFKSGQIGAAMAPVFIHRNDGVPCRAWSFNNQVLTILSGTHDARGFRQWEDAGRRVRKGAKAIYILVPVMKKIERTDATGAKKSALVPVAFKNSPVFRVEDTDGDPLPVDAGVASWIDSLPLIDVARAWKINVDAYNGTDGRALGKFIRRGDSAAIALGVKNLATWAHELMHAADARLGNLKEHGQHWRSETVAELGGAVLLEILGFTAESDRGGCWKYIESYAVAAGITPLAACMDVLKRTCEAIDSILTAADALRVPSADVDVDNTPAVDVAALLAAAQLQLTK